MIDLELGILSRTAFFSQFKAAYLEHRQLGKQGVFLALEYDCVSQLRSVISAEHISFLLSYFVTTFKDNLPSETILGRSLKEINAYIPDVNTADLANLIERLEIAFDRPVKLPNGRFIEIKPKLLSVFLPGVLAESDNADKVINQLAMFLGYVDQLEENKFHFHLDQETLTYLNKRIQIDHFILNALDHDELYVLYQPKVNLKSQQVIGAEALIRWSSPQLGLISPDYFIDRAEFTGMIQAMSLFVIKDAICLLNRARPIVANFSININLTASCIESAYFITELEQLVRSSGHAASAFEFEITETVAIKHFETAVEGLKRIHRLGCKIALDDFGTGYSCLSLLSKLPLDTLKIDKSFVKSMFNSVVDNQIIKTIVDLAEACNLQVIAEGIETIEQASVLVNELGCVQGQGYYFSRPIHPSVLLPQLEAQQKKAATKRSIIPQLFVSNLEV